MVEGVRPQAEPERVDQAMKGVDEGKDYWGKGARMQADPGLSLYSFT